MKNSFPSILTTACLTLLTGSSAWAATPVWNGTGSTWNVATNWTPAAGANGPITGDTATFDGTGVANPSVVFTAAGTTTSIAFSGTPGAYVIGTTGGFGIGVASGGSISMAATVANAETINAPLTLGGSYSFTNNATSSSGVLMIGDTVTGGSSAGTLTLNGSNTGSNTVSGAIVNGGATLGLTKSGVGNWILTGANNYGGVTAVSAGTLTVAGASGHIFGTGGITVSNGAALILDDRGAGNANTNRLGDSNNITLGNGSTFKYFGSDQSLTNSTETTGTFTLTGGPSTITVINSGSNSAKVTATATSGGFTRTAGTGGIALINGAGLGSSASAAQFVTATAPTLTGTTAGGTTGINSSVKNTNVASFLLGESGTGTGQNGTATGTANTFLTYNASTGYRPLNPTDEFTNNAIVAGNNTYITAATTAASTAAINSLVINGGDLTISNGATVTDSSAQLLFVTSNNIGASGTGTLAFGAKEGIITVNAGQSTTIGAALTGTGGVTVYGPGSIDFTGNSTGTLTGTLSIASNANVAVGNANAFGTMTIQNNGGTFKADTQARTISNTYLAAGASSTVGGSNNLTFTGSSTPAFVIGSSSNSGRFAYFNNTGTTTISGVLSLNNGNSGNSAEFIRVGNSGNLVITGPIQDNNSGNSSGSIFTLQFAGVGGTITINPTSGAGNSYLSTTSIFANSYGTLAVGGVNPLGTGTISLNGGATTAFFIQALTNNYTLVNNFNSGGSGGSIGYSGANNLTLSGNYNGNGTQIINVGTGLLTMSGTVTPGSTSAMTFVGSGDTALTGTLTGAQNINKTGPGTLTLGATNNLTAGMTFNGGTVVLDYSGANANRLNQSSITSAAAITLGGAKLQLNGGSYAQSLSGTNGTTINGGQSTVTQTGGGTSTIALGGLTRAANNGGALDFGAGVATTTNSNANGIIGGYATIGGTDWAVSNGGSSAITAFSGYSTLTSGSLTPASNYYFTGASGLTTSAGQTVNTLKLDASGTLTLGGILRVNTGGVLFTGTSNELITSGTLSASSGSVGDLIIHQYGTGTLTINSTIANGTGAEALTKAGPGTLVLSGANTYTGGTFIDQGILSVSADNNLGASGTITLNGGILETTAGFTSTRNISVSANGGTFQVDTGTLTLSGALGNGAVGYGSLIKTGAGTLVLSGNNGYSGATTINGGTLKVGSATALGADAKTTVRDTSPVFVNTGGTLDIAGFTVGIANLTLAGGTISDSVGSGSLSAYSYTLLNGAISAALTDTGNGAPVNPNLANTSTATALNKSSAGTVILSGNNSYTGATIISAGTLQIGNNGTSGTLGTGNVSDSGVLAFARSDATSVSNAISGAGAVSQIGAGTTTLTGPNSYSGGTTVSNGTLQVGSSSALGSPSGALAVNGGGILDLNQISQTVGATVLGTTATSTGSTITSTGGAATLTTSGVTVNGTGNTIAANATVTGAVTQAASSGLTVNGTAGNASLGSSATLAGTGTVGTVALSGSNILSSAGTLHTSGITVGGLNNSISSGTVTGNIGFTGTSALAVNGTATGSVTVSSGATLSGSGTVGALTVQSGGVVSPGNSPGTLTASSGTFLSGGSYTLQMNSDGSGAAGANWDSLALTGSLDVSSLSAGSPFTLTLQTLTGTNVAGALASFDPNTSHTWNSIVTTGSMIAGFNTNLFAIDTTGFQNGFTGSFSVALDGNNLDLVYTAVVPEPSTWAMMFGGLGLLLLVQRKRAKSIS